MQVSNNINSMLTLEQRLEKSASALSKLASNNTETNQKDNKEEALNSENKQKKIEDVDLVKEMVSQIEIPIAYTANAEVISTQSSMNKTLLDIKA
jgi:flagellar hook protein FlgE